MKRPLEEGDPMGPPRPHPRSLWRRSVGRALSVEWVHSFFRDGEAEWKHLEEQIMVYGCRELERHTLLLFGSVRRLD